MSGISVGGRRYAANLLWLERAGRRDTARTAEWLRRPWFVHNGNRTGFAARDASGCPDGLPALSLALMTLIGGGRWVALIEGAVAACVEWDAVRRGHKSVQDATLDWTRSIGTAAGGGLALTGGIGLATAAGFGPPGWLLIAAAGAGGALYGVNAYERIASTCAALYKPAGPARPDSGGFWSAGSTPPGPPPARFRGPESDAEAIEAIERYIHWRSGSSDAARR